MTTQMIGRDLQRHSNFFSFEKISARQSIPNSSFHHDPAITDFPPIDVSRGDGEDYVPYIDAEVEEPSTERTPSRCGRCEKNKTDEGETDDDGPEGPDDDGQAGEVNPDDSLSFATEAPVVPVSY